MKKSLIILTLLFFLISSIIFAADNSDKISRKADPFGYPIYTIPYSEIRQLLLNRKYNKLNNLLDDYQKKFEKDFRNEYQLYDAYGAFTVSIPAYEKFLNEWIAEFPDSCHPHIAKAFFLDEMGWESRGYKWAKDTTKEQFQTMREYHQQAKRELNKVIQLNPKLICPYAILIDTNKTLSEDEENREIMRRALEIFPYSFMLREVYMNSLEPRWGGSYPEMDAFAEDARRFVKQNPRLALLKGYAYADWAEMCAMNEKYSEAISLSKKALLFGECNNFNYVMAESYHYNEQSALASPWINKAMILEPQSVENLILHAEISYSLGNYANSVRDVTAALNIAHSYSWVKSKQQWITKQFVAKGYKQYQAEKYQEAISSYNYAVKIDPEYAEAYYWRGQAYIRQRKPQPALNDYQRSIALNPRHFESYLSLDWILFQSRQWDAIIKYWSKYIALEPKDGRAYRERGGAYFHKGDLKAAVADAKKAADLGDAEGEKLYMKYQDAAK